MSRRVDEAVARLAAQTFPEVVPDEAPRMSRGRSLPWTRSDDQDAAVGTVLHREPVGERPVRAGAGRRRVLIAAGLTVVAAAGSVAAVNWLSSPSDTSIATPRPLTFHPMASTAPAGLLEDLSGRAARQPAPSGAGPFLYTDRRVWAFSTSQDTAGHYLGGSLVEHRQQTWLAADGTGRFLRVEQDVPEGTPLTMDLPMPVPPSAPREARQADPEAVQTWMRQQGQDWTTVDWFQADARWHRLADPVVTAAFLGILAEQPDVTVDGRTTTRDGRAAVSVSTTVTRPGAGFPRQRLHLLIDPDTGLLLGTEVVALAADRAALGGTVSTPTTIGYTLWQDVRYVPDTTNRS